MGTALSTPFNLALISLVLYVVLFAVSFYYFWTLRSKVITRSQSSSKQIRGRYDDTKIIFFGALAASSLLDIPLFIGCLIEGGPTGIVNIS